MSSLRKLFQSAVKLDLISVRPVGNLELAWLALRNDAEFAARRAISLDPGFAPAKRILDLTLKRVVISPKPAVRGFRNDRRWSARTRHSTVKVPARRALS